MSMIINQAPASDMLQQLKANIESIKHAVDKPLVKEPQNNLHSTETLGTIINVVA